MASISLDYTQGCVNFRDVGKTINELAGQPLLQEHRLFRGGKLEFVERAEQVASPGSIINLRRSDDPVARRFGADYWHFPIAHSFAPVTSGQRGYEVYDTHTPIVRRWLNRLFRVLSTQIRRYPILMHCTSGKDRTAVAVGTWLTQVGVDRQLIIEDYLLSDGKIDQAQFEKAIGHVESNPEYFANLDTTQLQKLLVC